MENIKRSYVCSPCRADTKEGVEKNMMNARAYVVWVESKNGGKCRAYAPHSCLPAMFDDNDPFDRNLAISVCYDTLNGCDDMYVFGNKLSDGMKGEIKHAVVTGMPIHIDKPLYDVVVRYIKEFAVNYERYASFTYEADGSEV